MAYGIGLDIGITSVGFATVALNEQDEPCGILRMGSRIFDAAEHPKNGASLAAPRREARSARRRLRRHRHRLERIRNLLVESCLITQDGLDALFEGRLEDIYALRTRALDERLTNEELCRVLIHLAQRRGFRSNRKADAADKEAGKLLKAVSENDRRMEENGYRTVGEMLYKDPLFAEHQRNKGEAYLSTVTRAAVEQEARLILITQQNMGNDAVTEAFIEKYLDILLSQRSFDQGPGGNSPYGGNLIEDRAGRCTLEPEEPRAPKASYSFEYFQLLQKVNHIRLLQEDRSEPLTEDQRRAVIDFAHATADMTYAKIRKALSLPDTVRFNDVHYRDNAEEAEKKKLSCMRAYHEMRKALDKVAKGRISTICTDERNAIGRALTVFHTDESLLSELQKIGLESDEIDQLMKLSFSGYGHLSIKALNKITPYLEQGMTYDKACAAAEYHKAIERSVYLSAQAREMSEITSPVVRRAVAQTIKVVNALIREQGESPTFVNIELAREMSKDFAERNDIRRENEKNAKANEAAMEELRRTFGLTNPSGQDLVKYKLFLEQGGVCPYTQKLLLPEHLFEAGYADVDHIVPYSISFDDRYCNKVLTFASVNRKKKGNRLPLQFLKG